MRERVRITDVSPRDGLQNEPGAIATADKLRLVKLLAASGVDEIEVSSFVSPKWIPQLADAGELFELLRDRKPEGVLFSALVPNEKGMQAALTLNEKSDAPLIDKVAVFTAASETFSRKNTNASIAETIERFRPLIRAAQGAALRTRGYISCAVRCPFEGAIEPQRVAEVALRLLDLGVEEIDLGETIGAGTPENIESLLAVVLERLDETARSRLTLHLHDTFGRAAACIRTALQLGLRSFDGAAGGLGGCPYASTATTRAPGNISTEMLVRTVEAAGYQTSVRSDRLAEAGAFAAQLVQAGRATGSR